MGKYFSEFNEGDQFISPEKTITEADVTMFTGLSGDFNPLHTDAEYGKNSIFGERIAHGLLGLSVATGLIARLGLFDGTTIAFLGIEEWKFTKPIFLGDTIHVKVIIQEKRRSSKAGRGILLRYIEILNQHDEVVQSGVLSIMVKDK